MKDAKAAVDPVTNEPLETLTELFSAIELSQQLLGIAEDRLDAEQFKCLRWSCEGVVSAIVAEVQDAMPQTASILNLGHRDGRDFYNEAMEHLAEAVLEEVGQAKAN